MPTPIQISRQASRSSTRTIAHSSSTAIIAALLAAGSTACSFDSISIGFSDPNEDDGFGGYVPAHERARWEAPIWQRPPEDAEDQGPNDAGTGPSGEK